VTAAAKVIVPQRCGATNPRLARFHGDIGDQKSAALGIDNVPFVIPTDINCLSSPNPDFRQSFL
jgi:hypothetical protein